MRSGGFGPVLRRWKPLVAFAVLEIAIPWLLLGNAEQRLPSSLTGLLIAAVPLVGVVAGRLTGTGDHVDARRWAGLLLGLVGVGVLVGLDLGGLSALALVEVGLTVIGYATAPIIMARHLSDLPRFPVVCAGAAAVGRGLGAVRAHPLAPARGRHRRRLDRGPRRWSAPRWRSWSSSR